MIRKTLSVLGGSFTHVAKSGDWEIFTDSDNTEVVVVKENEAKDAVVGYGDYKDLHAYGVSDFKDFVDQAVTNSNVNGRGYVGESYMDFSIESREEFFI